MRRRTLILSGVAALSCTMVGPALAGRRIRIGFAQDTLANDWRAAQARQFVEALAGNSDLPDIDVLVTNAGGSTAQQIMDFDDLVAQGVDILVTSPRDGAALAPAIAAAHDQGVPVILLTRRAATESFTAFIGPDDHAIGYQAGEFLARRTGGNARILMLAGVPTASTAVGRTSGFLAAVERYPGMIMAASRTANYLRADALQATEEVIESKIAFDAVFAQSDSMASGARMALEAAGLKVPIIGIDYIPEAREAIRAGRQDATFTYPTCAREGAAAVLDLLNGRPILREVTVNSVLVTKENVDDIQPIF